MEGGQACGFQTLLQLLDPQHFHPFWGIVCLLQPILRLQNRLPGHWRRTPSYSVAFLRLHRKRRGRQSLPLPQAQFPLRSLSLLADSAACCPHGHPQNHSYHRQICRDLGRREQRCASRMTRTGQTCRREGGRGLIDKTRKQKRQRGAVRFGFLHLIFLLLHLLAFSNFLSLPYLFHQQLRSNIDDLKEHIISEVVYNNLL